MGKELLKSLMFDVRPIWHFFKSHLAISLIPLIGVLALVTGYLLPHSGIYFSPVWVLTSQIKSILLIVTIITIVINLVLYSHLLPNYVHVLITSGTIYMVYLLSHMLVNWALPYVILYTFMLVVFSSYRSHRYQNYMMIAVILGGAGLLLFIDPPSYELIGIGILLIPTILSVLMYLQPKQKYHYVAPAVVAIPMVLIVMLIVMFSKTDFRGSIKIEHPELGNLLLVQYDTAAFIDENYALEVYVDVGFGFYQRIGEEYMLPFNIPDLTQTDYLIIKEEDEYHLYYWYIDGHYYSSIALNTND